MATNRISWLATAILVLGLATVGCTKEPEPDPANPLVEMKTSKGAVRIELFEEKAPVTVKNFLEYARDGHYDGTVFHRVIQGFMIQGGGFDGKLKQKPTRDPIKNEADNGLKNLKGTLAMARTDQVDSATAQFFINLADNAFLDHKAATPQGFGYAVFGRVVSGMDVVEKIESVPTTTHQRLQNVPTEPIVIESIRPVSGES